MSWPQPHEGVSGVDRTRDDLLSLEKAALARRVIMIDMAEKIYRLTLWAPHTPERAAEFSRMKNPRMGDLVMEVTIMRAFRDIETRASGFGILLGERTEWSSTDEQWNAYVAESAAEGLALTEEDRVTETAWYVQYGPAAGDICRWANADFIAVPVGPLYHTKDMQP